MPRERKKKISVITSAYNEEEGIRACVETVRGIMEGLGDKYEYEHVLADNCSTDKTLEILRQLAKEDPRVKVIANSRNFGAEKSAFNAYKFTTGDAVVGITADMQEPPSVIPRMVELWEQGYDVIYGVYKNPHEGFFIRMVRKLYYWGVDKLSTETLPKDFMGFALMDRRVIDEVLAVDDYAPYIRGIIANVGFKQIGIPYERAPRLTGGSKHGLAFLFDFGLNGLISYSVVPIRAATLGGLGLFALSILAIIALVIIRFTMPWLQAPGITTVVILVTFFSGIQLAFFGMLGEYVGAIHSQTRRKPFVIVRDTYNVSEEAAALARTRGASVPPSVERAPELAAAPTTSRSADGAPPRHVLVFGANGALGGAIARVLEGDGCSVSRAARTKDENRIWIDPEADKGLAALADLPPLAAVVWAQGANVNDDPATRKEEDYERVMNANVGYVLKTMEELLRRDLLAPGAALCVVSSIWQEQARAGKLSYTISKAAVGGLVRAAALDLAPKQIRINAVLPGVVDTPMTRAMLSAEQVKRVEQATPRRRLTTADEVADVVAMMVSSRSAALTGQSIVVDGGFSLARYL